jgi:hypothetical protein
VRHRGHRQLGVVPAIRSGLFLRYENVPQKYQRKQIGEFSLICCTRKNWASCSIAFCGKKLKKSKYLPVVTQIAVQAQITSGGITQFGYLLKRNRFESNQKVIFCVSYF